MVNVYTYVYGLTVYIQFSEQPRIEKKEKNDKNVIKDPS